MLTAVLCLYDSHDSHDIQRLSFDGSATALYLKQSDTEAVEIWARENQQEMLLKSKRFTTTGTIPLNTGYVL